MRKFVQALGPGVVILVGRAERDVVHTAGAGMRGSDIGAHRHVQLGRRAALAHFVNMHVVVVRFRVRIVADMTGVHDMDEHHVGRPQLRHRHGNRS